MKENITIDELDMLPEGSYAVIDMRDEYSFGFGHIDGALNIPRAELENGADLPKDKMLIICCRVGIISANTAELLRGKGYNSVSLAGGYAAWLKKHIGECSRAEDIEQSLRGKFSRTILKAFTKANNEYQLIDNGDKIAVCISGGKDSMLMAKLFQELKRHGRISFEPVYLVMDPGYSRENRAIIEKNAEIMNIPIVVFETTIFESVYNVKDSACYLCSRMRRGHLYNKARELGCNKIALGHHYDDIIETILMSMLYGGQVRTMMPKVKSANFEGMELIRPMYFIREEEIKAWRDFNNLHFIQCACKFTDTCTACTPTGTGSKRVEIKNLIAELKKVNPQVEGNIFHSVENVNLNAIIECKFNNERHKFLEFY